MLVIILDSQWTLKQNGSITLTNMKTVKAEYLPDFDTTECREMWIGDKHLFSW